jgi:hypothetical protein
MKHSIDKKKGLLSSDFMRKLLIAIALIVCIILVLSAVTFIFYVQERREHLRIQMGTFDIEIDVASLGKFERMEYAVCGEKTLIEPYEDEDGSILWTEKISTPKQLLTPEGAPRRSTMSC